MSDTDPLGLLIVNGTILGFGLAGIGWLTGWAGLTSFGLWLASVLVSATLLYFGVLLALVALFSVLAVIMYPVETAKFLAQATKDLYSWAKPAIAAAAVALGTWLGAQLHAAPPAVSGAAAGSIESVATPARAVKTASPGHPTDASPAATTAAPPAVSAPTGPETVVPARPETKGLLSKLDETTR